MTNLRVCIWNGNPANDNRTRIAGISLVVLHLYNRFGMLFVGDVESSPRGDWESSLKSVIMEVAMAEADDHKVFDTLVNQIDNPQVSGEICFSLPSPSLGGGAFSGGISG